MLLSVIGVVATTAAFWLHNRVVDTETFVWTIRPTLDDPAVTDALGEFTSDEIFEAVDLRSRFEERLGAADEYLADQPQDLIELGDPGTAVLEGLDPPGLADLASPLAAVVETPVRDAVNDFIGSEEFRAGFEAAVAVAHTKAVALLRGDVEELPNVVVETGEVRVDLVPLIAATLRSVIEGGLQLVDLDAAIPSIPVAETPRDGLRELADALGTSLPPTSVKSSSRPKAARACSSASTCGGLPQACGSSRRKPTLRSQSRFSAPVDKCGHARQDERENDAPNDRNVPTEEVLEHRQGQDKNTEASEPLHGRDLLQGWHPMPAESPNRRSTITG